MKSGNILKEIWLNKENVKKAYSASGRTDIKEVVGNLLELLEKLEFKQKWIEEYRKDMINYLKEKHKTNNLFPTKFSNDIIKVLKEIDNGKEILKRVLSIKCFNNSKYFEQNIENIIVRIIKKYLLNLDIVEEYSNEDILLEAGISRYPEVIEFCGDIEYIIEGEKIEYKKETLGSYINSYNIKNMENLKIKNTNKIMFIENKANYIDYIQNKKTKNELVIYHGGMYSPIKGEFFKKIYKASANTKFYHWSDIDIGGFKIFARLKENIINELEPFKMDKNTLKENQKHCKNFNEDYKALLLKLRKDSRYSMFFDVIDFMLENNICLEQESLIL